MAACCWTADRTRRAAFSSSTGSDSRVGGLLAGIGAGFLPKPFNILGPAFGITFGIYFLITATGRLEFREEGIWQYWGLLPWSKIEACRWSGDYTLLLQAKTRFALMGRGALARPSRAEGRDRRSAEETLSDLGS